MTHVSFILIPRIIRKEPYNHKTDVWSLGVLLYEAWLLLRDKEVSSLRSLTIAVLGMSGDPRSLSSLGDGGIEAAFYWHTGNLAQAHHQGGSSIQCVTLGTVNGASPQDFLKSADFQRLEAFQPSQVSLFP